MPNGNAVDGGFKLDSRFNGVYYYRYAKGSEKAWVVCNTNTNEVRSYKYNSDGKEHAIYVKLDVLEALMADAKGRVRWY